MSIEWITPVTDRVEADCVYGNPKGCISADFLNRIESNTKYIQDCLDYYHISHASISVSVDKWSRELYLRIAEFQRLQQNLINIRATGIINQDTPVLIKSEAEQQPLYTLLNDMEKILLDIKILLDGMLNRFRISGTFTLGNNIQLQILRR